MVDLHRKHSKIKYHGSLFYLKVIGAFVILMSLPACGDDDSPVIDEASGDTIDAEEPGIDLCIDSLNRTRYAGGCENLLLYNSFNDSVFFTLEIDPTKISITDTCQVYNINTDGIEAAIQMAGDNPDVTYFNFCSDVVIQLGTPDIFPATSGQMKIVSDIKQVADTSTDFRASVLLNNIRLEGIDSVISEIKYYNILQGWVPPN